MSDPIVAHLRSCCRQIMGKRPGAGFFITPDILVTCHHVVGGIEGNILAVKQWRSDGSLHQEDGEVIARLPGDDIALVKVGSTDNDFVELDPNMRVSDPVIGIGFPARTGRDEFDQFSATFEGETFYRRAGGATESEGKLKGGQIEPGFSGGPLLNMNTLGVSGMVTATRDRRTDLGGWIVPAERLGRALDSLGVNRVGANPAWQRAVDAQKRLENDKARGARGQESGRFSQQIPPLPSHYVERSDDLDDLVSRLVSDESSNQALAIAAVHGLGGVGKTSIAIAAARSDRVRERFPDGVLWTSLGQTPHLLQTMTYWLRSLGEKLDVPLSLESGSTYLRTLLQNKSMLIVIDDAWDEADAQPLLVGGSACRTLLTTRLAHVADRVGAKIWTLNAMSDDESLMLLKKRSAGASLDATAEEDARLLVSELGHLPLALELAGALAGRGYSLSDIRDQLLAVEVDEEDHGVSSPGRLAIDKCLALSINLLAARDQPLWEAFIRLGMMPDGVKFDAAIAAHFLGKPIKAATMILNALQDDALLQKADSAYTMHALLRDAAQKRLGLPPPSGLGLPRPEAHAGVVRNYRKTHPGPLTAIPDDGYIHDHLAWHLAQANDFNTLRDLLSAEDAGGRNIWFQIKDQQGELASYRADLEKMLALAIKQGPEFATEQMLWAFCLSSISGARRLSPAVLGSLVRSRIWTAAKGYYWVVSEDSSDKRLELLVSLAKAVTSLLDNGPQDQSDLPDIVGAAISSAKETLLGEAPTARRTVLAAALVELVPMAQQEALLREIVQWCAGPSNQVTFLIALPESLRAPVMALSLAKISEWPVGLAKAEILARCIPYCPSPMLPRLFAETFSTIDECFALARPLPQGQRLPQARDGVGLSFPSDPFEATGAHRQQQNGSIQIATHEDTSAPESFDLTGLIVGDRSQSESLAITIATALAMNTPHEFREEAQKRLNALHRIGLIPEFEVRDLDIATDVSSTPTSSDDFVYEIGLSEALGKLPTLAADSDIETLAGTISAVDFRTDFFAALETGRLEGLKQEKLLSCLSRHFYWSSELALYSLRTDPKALWTEAMSKMRPADSDFEYDSIMRIGLHVLTDQEMLKSLLEEYFLNNDLNQQTAAVYKLMPFLPSEYPENLLATYADREAVGRQLSSLTEIMIDLIGAISAGRLSAFVEAASNRHSEWWVVEALTLTMTKLKSPDEVEAMLSATTRIRNADLHARIVGRAARRAADLGYVELAVNAVCGINAPAARDDELHELGIRLASAGNMEAAGQVAARIGSIETRARAYLGIALEMGALGRREDAYRALAEIPLASERELGAKLLGPETVHHAVPLDDRLALRAEVAESASFCESVSGAVEALSREIPERVWMKPMGEAAAKGDAPEVARLSEMLWTASASNNSLARDIAQRPRIGALKLVGEAAPIIAASAGGANVTGAIEAIKTVSRWWP